MILISPSVHLKSNIYSYSFKSVLCNSSVESRAKNFCILVVRGIIIHYFWNKVEHF